MELRGRVVTILWIVTLLLYAACWFLPIIVEGDERFLGYQGARFAHSSAWELIAQGETIESAGDVLAVLFRSIGWLANELFLLALLVLRTRPAAAVRLLAAALGIMLAWQLVFIENFPLLVGYWAWVAAGALALWLAAARLAESGARSVGALLSERPTIALFAAPIAIVALAQILDRV